MIKKVRWTILLYVLLFAVSPGICHASAAEFYDQLEDPIFQELFDYAYAQGETLGISLDHCDWLETALEYKDIDEDIYEFLKNIPNPERAAIVYPSDKFYNNAIRKQFIEGPDGDTAAKSLQTATCFGATYNTNVINKLNVEIYGDRKLAAFSDSISVYGVTQIQGFEDIAYVVLMYAPDLPYIVTAFSALENGEVLTKTTFVIRSAEMYNEAFMYQVQSLWGIDSLDIIVYRYSDKNNS